jgi:aflatoxin B1 aldehyde reductase
MAPGNYSAVARIPEAELFPTLRKHNMSFYAYSPLAGGLLTKSAKDIEAGAGRFSKSALGDLYRKLYVKPAYMEALSTWEQIAKDEGIDRAELGFRWTAWNSQIDGKKGDGLIIGASRPEQVHQTLEYLKKGPISDKAAKAIDEIWQLIKHEAPIDNFNQ